MKDKIHPKYQKCIVNCACGNTFETRSTLPSIEVEICAECHPFYTGKKKLLDASGRVEKFKKKYSKFKKNKQFNLPLNSKPLSHEEKWTMFKIILNIFSFPVKSAILIL